ncbi:hypothetical protein CY34DRAFT_808979 [Suillus luteus UH-Slu-Lm8-n1]|uniref:Uncharacterized protein n=1 Tax=Suillus luteus UH-Slu-Lm8-n1 TaxID=930992 RepID=A0A0D0AKW2_9AGAM|nr:hypothetical protein CY34DRAFT_808979 [Suillus luteus UH-Slu-Lm8-n1]
MTEISHMQRSTRNYPSAENLESRASHPIHSPSFNSPAKQIRAPISDHDLTNKGHLRPSQKPAIFKLDKEDIQHLQSEPKQSERRSA